MPKLRSMLKLGVNIDHVATLREARYRGRGFGEPDPVEAAKICEAAGAHGITIHLREDRRHIQDRDVWKIREVVKTRLNLEMANAPEIFEYAVAKWLCQKSVIFSWRGRREWIMRKSQRWRESLMTVRGANAPVEVVATYPGLPISPSTSSGTVS